MPVSNSHCEQQSVTTTSAADSVSGITPLATKCDEAAVDSLTTGHTDANSELPYIVSPQGRKSILFAGTRNDYSIN